MCALLSLLLDTLHRKPTTLATHPLHTTPPIASVSNSSMRNIALPSKQELSTPSRELVVWCAQPVNQSRRAPLPHVSTPREHPVHPRIHTRNGMLSHTAKRGIRHAIQIGGVYETSAISSFGFSKFHQTTSGDINGMPLLRDTNDEAWSIFLLFVFRAVSLCVVGIAASNVHVLLICAVRVTCRNAAVTSHSHTCTGSARRRSKCTGNGNYQPTRTSNLLPFFSSTQHS